MSLSLGDNMKNEIGIYLSDISGAFYKQCTPSVSCTKSAKHVSTSSSLCLSNRILRAPGVRAPGVRDHQQQVVVEDVAEQSNFLGGQSWARCFGICFSMMSTKQFPMPPQHSSQTIRMSRSNTRSQPTPMCTKISCMFSNVYMHGVRETELHLMKPKKHLQ